MKNKVILLIVLCFISSTYSLTVKEYKRFMNTAMKVCCGEQIEKALGSKKYREAKLNIDIKADSLIKVGKGMAEIHATLLNESKTVLAELLEKEGLGENYLNKYYECIDKQINVLCPECIKGLSPDSTDMPPATPEDLSKKEQILNLLKIDENNYKNQSNTFVTQGGKCNVRVTETFKMGEFSIDDGLTRLTYPYTSIRPNHTYSCEGGPWSDPQADTFTASVIADIVIIDNKLSFKNPKVVGKSSETKAHEIVIQHLLSLDNTFLN